MIMRAAADAPNMIKKLFLKLDRRYFRGRLQAGGWQVEVRNLDKDGELEWYITPAKKVRAFKTEDGMLGIAIHATRTIFLHYHDNPDELRGTLLHEMVHASIKRADGHGRRFVNELKRLRSAGEDCLRYQIVDYGLALLHGGAEKAAHGNARENDIRVTGSSSGHRDPGQGDDQ